LIVAESDGIWEELVEAQTRPNLDFFLEGLRKIAKILRIAAVSAEILT
jgi:hypothetical protein